MASKKNAAVAFFKGKRKCISVGPVTLLKNASGDRRMKFICSINLTTDGVGQPAFIASMFEAVAKENSAITLLKSSVELEGTAISFFSTDKIQTGAMKVTNCTLRSFSMTTKKTRGKDLADVVVTFSIYAPASKPLWDWGFDMQGNETFGEFVPTQMSFGEVAEDSDDDGDDTKSPD